MYIHILWTDLLRESDASDVLKQQRSFLGNLHEREIEDAIIEMSTNLKGNNYPFTYEIVTTHEDIEKLRRVIENDGTVIIYSGTGLDFKELLIVLYFMITHMNKAEDVLLFLRKLVTGMNDINQLAEKKIQSIIRSIERVCKL